MRIGQVQRVLIYTPYLNDLIDEAHKAKHLSKVATAGVISGDLEVDPVYKTFATEMQIFEQYLTNTNSI